MWNWIRCYLSGHHEYTMWCEPGAVFLRCVNCGRRSQGWAIYRRTDDLPAPHGRSQKAGLRSVARGILHKTASSA